MRTILTWVLGIAAAVMLVASLLSMLPSDQWFIRALDMVRQPALYLAALLGVLSLLAARGWRWGLVAAFAAVALIQLWRLWPYLPFARETVALYDGPEQSCFTALSLNVKQSNTGDAEVAALIREENPDLLFLMETNGEWLQALQPVLSAYPQTVVEPQDNTFGLALATRLPLASSRTVDSTSADTPTLYATLTGPTGDRFEFIGLHPRAPLPGQDTDARDASILRAGAATPDRLADALVMGDFNDVPWSGTAVKFREGGNWRDPRLGRGTHQTFPADYAWAGYPLDHLMVRGDVEVRSFEVLDDVGADHLPLRAEVCVAGG